MDIPKFLSQVPEEEKTSFVLELLEIINFKYEENQKLKDEIARLKGEKGKPCIKPSRLEKPDKPGKKSKTTDKKQEVIKPEIILTGSVYKAYKKYTVQDIIWQPFTRYHLECWKTPDGDYIYGRLPDEIFGTHFGPTLEEKKKYFNDRFDKIFTEKPCFSSLNKALERIYKNKEELLLVLERPEIFLHNNMSERDIREYVKKRKISGSSRSSTGRRARDTFASLKKTCQKHGIS